MTPLDSSRCSNGSDSEPHLNQPIHSERHIRIIVIGAGASGLLFAYKLQRSFENYSLTVYEKNEAVGGTWFENRYPGCACDVPAHTYTWSFEPKPDWSSTYSGSREIFQYFNDFADKYALRQYCHMRHQVIGATWNSNRSGYDVQVRDLQAQQGEFNDFCDILVNACGILNAWKWPDIRGLNDYKGTLLHTANWDESINLEGKSVGLIGNGSSAIQVLPAIQPHVAKLTTFIRRPTWVSPIPGMEQKSFTKEEKREFATNTQALTQYRKTVESGMNSVYPLFLRHTQTQRSTRSHMIKQMEEKLQNHDLSALLIPDFAVGCRRITPGPGYLESLGAENVEVVSGNIDRITDKGCVSNDGKEYPVDVLICATGFDTSFRPRFPVIGPEQNNLQDDWATEPQSYLGVAAAGYPNYFTLIGPNSPVGNGPVLFSVECQVDYLMRLIDRYQTHNIKSLAPHREAVADFIEYKDRFMRQTVWVDDCVSWYKTEGVNGKVTALWPGSALHYVEALDEVRWEDWDVHYQGNRFCWLGNGYSQTEIDPTADWGYYMRDHDDGEFMSRRKRLQIRNKSGTKTQDMGSFQFVPKI